MTEAARRSPDAAAEVDAYVAYLLDALGARQPIEVLAETPAALGRAVAGLTKEQDGTPEIPGKWAVRHVVQHLADSELVGAFRFRMILSHDTPEIPGYDQDLWAKGLAYGDSDLPTALTEFEASRRSNVRLLRRLAPAQLQRAMRHKERGTESLDQMVKLYAGHDMVHLRQIARIRCAIGASAPEI